MAFPEAFLDQVKARADIVEIVGEYVPLHKTGANFKALCPFHTEKTPSFIVSPDKQIFHCFGCGKGGNVFTFLMEHEKISFSEAVEQLARRYNIPLPATRSKTHKSAYDLFDVHNIAAQIYHKNLFISKNAAALEYLTKKRGITRPTIEEFLLGVSFSEWDGLLAVLKKKGIPEPVLRESGLFVSKNNSFYDRFRSRIMFPINNVRGKTIGFGARALDDALPKYINSPDTQLFKKGSILYGLDKAKHHITEQNSAIVVEGYMDMIALYQAGIKNVAATLGTAFSLEHLQSIKRFCGQVTLLFDSDAAGLEANIRAIATALGQGIEIRVASLPEGEDPDTYVAKYGRGEFFAKILQNSVDFFEFLIKFLESRFDLSKPIGKSGFINALFDLIKAIPDDIIKEGYIKLLAKQLGVSENALFARFEVFSAKGKGRQGVSGAKGAEKPMAIDIKPVEYLLAVCARDLNYAAQLMDFWTETDFTEDWQIQIWRILEEFVLEGKREADLSDVEFAFQKKGEGPDEEIWKGFYKLVVQLPENISSQTIEKCKELICKKRVEDQISEMKKRYRELHEAGHEEEALVILQKVYHLIKDERGDRIGKAKES